MYEARLSRLQKSLDRKRKQHKVATAALSLFLKEQGMDEAQIISEVRRQLPGKNLSKTRDNIAALHKRIGDIRKEWQHRTTTQICSEHKLLGIEDLNVSGMMRTNLAKSLADIGLSEITRQIQYKAKLYGSEVVEASRWYPSSQICSQCGNKDPEMKDLSRRQYTCKKCGLEMDRDANAAKNLENIARQGSVESYPECPGEVKPGIAGSLELAGQEDPNMLRELADEKVDGCLSPVRRSRNKRSKTSKAYTPVMAKASVCAGNKTEALANQLESFDSTRVCE
jgi:putative transposase